jgi:hypothetical protein
VRDAWDLQWARGSFALSLSLASPLLTALPSGLAYRACIAKIACFGEGDVGCAISASHFTVIATVIGAHTLGPCQLIRSNHTLLTR